MTDAALEAWAEETREDVKKLLRELCVIPAPSHFEEKRAEHVLEWMRRNGGERAFIDGKKNVIWPVDDDGRKPLAVFMAHTDVVFPDTGPLPLHIEGTEYHCPGAGDDTANLSVLLYAAKYFAGTCRAGRELGLLVVANSCEEGLGNLDGCREIVDAYRDRIRFLVTVDGNTGSMVTRAVGSHRYRVTLRTEGGHSYGAFGNRNAIAYLSSMISSLYDVRVPQKPGTRTTYNVGLIEGGTSVNTIAQEASMLYEYRSDDRECLEQMKRIFLGIAGAYRAMCQSLDVELLGERPCNGPVDEEAFERLKAGVRAASEEITGKAPSERSGSTDANYPLSLGIPAVCTGACIMHGCHTREEYVDTETLYTGMRYLLALMSRLLG
jgi:acetylornithine deacetylase/succinyl-diaminopimelate desuccinylase-like protein